MRSTMKASNSSKQIRETMQNFDGLDLLGAGRPLNAIPLHPLSIQENGSEVRHRCPSALIDWGGRHLTLRERAMIRLMNAISDVPGWERGVFDSVTVDNLRSQVAKAEQDITDTMLHFVSGHYFCEAHASACD